MISLFFLIVWQNLVKSGKVHEVRSRLSIEATTHSTRLRRSDIGGEVKGYTDWCPDEKWIAPLQTTVSLPVSRFRGGRRRASRLRRRVVTVDPLGLSRPA